MINFFAGLPGDDFRDSDVFGKGAVAINTQYLEVATDMSLSSTTLVALTTGDVGFGGYKIARDKGSDFTAHFDDFARELMAKDTRNLHTALCPCIPVVDMHICTTDGGGLHLYKYITRANRWNIH